MKIKVQTIALFVMAALCAFPARVFAYQSLWVYFTVTMFGAGLLASVGIEILVKKEKVNLSLLAILTLAWIGYIIFHTFAIAGEHYRTYAYIGYCSVFLFAFLSLQRKLLARNEIIGIFYIFGIVESLICILQVLGGLASANKFFAVTGTWENPNATAMFLMVCLPFGLFFLIKKYKKTAIASIVILLIAIALLKCRTAYIGATIVFAVYFLQNEKIKNAIVNHKIIFSLILIIVLLSGIWLYNFKKNSSDGRLFIWKISTEMIDEKPVLGFGYGLFERNYNLAQAVYFQSGRGSATEKQNASRVNMAYNEFIEQTVEGGSVGLLFYCGFLAFSLYFAAKKKDFEALAVIATVIAASFFNFVIQCLPLCVLLFAYCASLENKTFKINKLILIFIVFLSLVFFINQSKLMFAQIHHKQAVNIAKAGDPMRALQILQKNENRIETSESFLRNYGFLLLKNNQTDEAIKQVQKASEYTSNIDTYYLLSDCYVEKHDFAKSEQSLQTIAFMIPTNLQSRYRLMKIYQFTNQPEKAKAAAQQIVDIQPKITTKESDFYKAEAEKYLAD